MLRKGAMSVLLMSFIYGALVVEGSCETEKLVDIHVLGFFPCDTSSELSSIYSCDGIIDRIPTVKLALEEINERCDLLPGYRLVVDYANSAVSCPRMLYYLQFIYLQFVI